MARAPSTVLKIISRAYREPNIVAIGKSPTDAQNDEGLDNLNSFMSMALGQDLGEPLFDWLAPVPQRTAPVAANWPQGPYGYGDFDPSVILYGGISSNVTPYPPNNARIIWGGNTSTIYFSERPENGARTSLLQGSGLASGGSDGNVLTLDGNGRYIGMPGNTPPFAATQQFTFSATSPPAADWIYVSAYGLWMPIGTLALTDNFVFPPEYDDYFVIGLAGRLCPKYKAALSAESQAAFVMMQGKVKSEFAQKHDTVYGAWEYPNSLQSYNAGRWLYPNW